MKPKDAMKAGRKFLNPIMDAAGFLSFVGTSGNSSGGPCIDVSYIKGDRHLTLSYRYALGLVSYRVGHHSISHNDFMRSIGKAHDSKYLCFSRDSPMAGFEALAYDLENFCQDFLTGTGEEIVQAAIALDS